MGLPENWLLLPIAEVCRVNPRASHNLSDDEVVSFLPMKGIDDVWGSISEMEEKPFAEVKKGYTPFCEGDVLFAKITPCMENGKAAIARGLINGVGYGSTEFHVLRPKEILNADFLHYFIRQKSFRAWAKNSFVGSAGQQRVSTQFFNYAKIPVPPLEEQQEVVNILQQVENLRRMRQDSMKKTEKLASALFLEMFGDPISNLHNWEKRRLKELGCVKTGNTPPRNNPNNYGEGIEWIKTDNINTPYLYITKAEENLSIEGEKRARVVEEGALLVTCIAGSLSVIGNSAVTDRKVSFNQQINSFQPHSKFPCFYHYLFFILKPYIQFRVAGNMKSIINKSTFENIDIINPPVGLKRIFSEKIKIIENQKMHLQAQLNRLDGFLKTLQQQAFSGKLTENWRKLHSDLQTPNIKATHIRVPEEKVISHRESLFPIQEHRKAIYEQLSSFQKTIWDYVLEKNDYIVDDLPALIAELPEDITEDDQTRLKTTLATLTALGLIAKTSLPDEEEKYVTVYRALREEDERMNAQILDRKKPEPVAYAKLSKSEW